MTPLDLGQCGAASKQEWANVWAADVIVRDKVVHLWFCEDQPEEERRAVRVAAQNVPGIRDVEQHIVPAPAVPLF